jgi:hypothetical protein
MLTQMIRYTGMRYLTHQVLCQFYSLAFVNVRRLTLKSYGTTGLYCVGVGCDTV